MPVPAARRHAGATVTGAAGGVVLGVGLVLAPVAWAHDGLESSRPAAGSELAVAPSSVDLVFSGDVVSASMEVVDGCGRAVPSVLTRDGAELHAALGTQEHADSRGGWVVRWGTVGGDGHPVQGELGFSVVGTPDCATPAPDGDLEVTAPVTAAVAAGPAGADPPAGAAASSAAPGSSAPTGALMAGGVVVAAGAWVVGDRLRRGRSRRSPGTGS